MTSYKQISYKGLCNLQSLLCYAKLNESDNFYNHILRMIDWMPKLGLSGYFHQYFVPYTFFENWYKHPSNPEMETEQICADDVSAMVESSVAAIKERGMMFHQVGHGWTCEPFGIPGRGWEPQEYHLTKKQEAVFALVNGKRGVWKGIGLNTNLCYSNPGVMKTLVDTIVAYAFHTLRAIGKNCEKNAKHKQIKAFREDKII